MASLILMGVLVIGGLGLTMAEPGDQADALQLRTVFAFEGSVGEPKWRVVNDSVMGGVSTSSSSLSAVGTAVFSGNVSLENNGGFASVRSDPKDLGLGGTEGLILRVKGDGNLYKISARQDTMFDGVTYQATFPTKPGEWVLLQVPFQYMLPTFRGINLSDRPPLNAARIQSCGFLIADKQAGAFRLELDEIAAYSAAWSGPKVTRTEEQWRELLGELQYHVTRERGTEEAFTGHYHAHAANGVYHCVCCGNSIFLSAAKFETDTGWPSFYAPTSATRIATRPDTTLGLDRTEVVCARCDAHLGHVFDDGPQPTGLRYCMNSAALRFKPAEQE